MLAFTNNNGNNKIDKLDDGNKKPIKKSKKLSKSRK